MKKIEICPSILSANLLNLKEEIKILEKAGLKYIHFDVMDGHFVPSISFGSLLMKDIKDLTNMFLDVHLMTTNPMNFIEEFALAGAFSITVHVEAYDDVFDCVRKIKNLNCKAAVAINPKTSVEKILNFLDYLDMVVVMTVNPGFGGQELIFSALDKVKKLKEIKKDLVVQVDGGVKLNNLEKVIKVGADLVVVGSYIFKSKEILKSVKELQSFLDERRLERQI